jgi:hypothetical protein
MMWCFTHWPLVPSAVEGPWKIREGVSTSLDTNGIGNGIWQ